MLKYRIIISPTWLISLSILISAHSCIPNPIRYTDEAVQCRTDTEVLFVMNDSLKTDIHLRILPKYIRPKREIVISFFLEANDAQQLILSDTIRHHPQMMEHFTKKTISIASPVKLKLLSDHGRLTYNVRYRNPNNGAYKDAYFNLNEWDSSIRVRPIIAKVFADSTSYLQQKTSKIPTP